MTKRPGSGCSANKGLKDRRRDSSSPVPSPEPRPSPGAIRGCQEGPCGDVQGNVSHPACPPCLCLLPPPCPIPITHTDVLCLLLSPQARCLQRPVPLPGHSSRLALSVLSHQWHRSAVTPTPPLSTLPPWPRTPCTTLSLGKKSHPPHPCPFAKPKSQSFFSGCIFFFSMLSATLDEQSPPLRLPSLTHVVIRSCRYPAVICLVSALVQTRLANRCGLQLQAAASHFPTLADGGAAGQHTLVLSLPQCPAGCPARCFQGFPACKGGEVAGAN